MARKPGNVFFLRILLKYRKFKLISTGRQKRIIFDINLRKIPKSKTKDLSFYIIVDVLEITDSFYFCSNVLL